MKYLTLDIETYAFAFIIVAKDDSGEYHDLVDTKYVSTEVVRKFLKHLQRYDWVVTFNGASFDLRVLCWIASQKTPYVAVSRIHREASALIEDQKMKKDRVFTSDCWRCNRNLLDASRRNHFDVFKCYTVDKTKGLKHWELYRGQSVKESSVDFNSPACTSDELADCVEYCRHDVNATESLFLDKACQELMEARGSILEECGPELPPDVSPAELADVYCYGFSTADETRSVMDYVPFDEFKVPQQVMDGLKSLAKDEIPGFEWRGVHYGKGGAHYVKAGRNKGVHIFDVASMYPHIIKLFTKLKTDEAQQRYVGCLNKRLELKHLKKTDPSKYSKAKDLGYKLVLNSLSGKFREKSSLAYAPNCGLAMCIIGQLAITEAAAYAVEDRFEDLVEINTDSFAVVGERSIARAKEYCSKIQHGLTYEEDFFVDSYWKDVNNYVVFNEDGSIKETHGQDSSDLVKKGNEPIVAKSLFSNVMLEEGSTPVLKGSTEFKDWIVKYSKSASSKNATIGGVPMRFKHYYFLWTTEDCPDAKPIEFSSERIDKAHGLIKSRYGVYAFDPEDLRKYSKWLDKSQYVEDLKQLLVVWNRGDLCSEFAFKLKRAKVIARNKAIRECRTFKDVFETMNNFYSNVEYRL